MKRLFKRYWLIVPLLLVAILVRDWIEGPETLTLEEPLVMRELRADYYLEDFVTRRFDDAGALQYLIRGDTLSHYPIDGRAEIVAPSVELRRPEGSWHLRADGGRLLQGENGGSRTVTLAGNVVIEREAGADDSPEARAVTIRTDELALAIDSNVVSTDARVRIESPGMRLEATGLQSFIDAGKLELLSNVTGSYEVALPSTDGARPARGD